MNIRTRPGSSWSRWPTISVISFARTLTVKRHIAGIAKHINSFWTKSMRRKITAHGEDGLDELPREALRRLAAQSAPAVAPLAHGGGCRLVRARALSDRFFQRLVIAPGDRRARRIGWTLGRLSDHRFRYGLSVFLVAALPPRTRSPDRFITRSAFAARLLPSRCHGVDGRRDGMLAP